jgi:thiamine kinase-like enzyme
MKLDVPIHSAFHCSSDEQSMQILFQEWLHELLQGHELITACLVLNTHHKQYFKEASQIKSFVATAYELTLCNSVTKATRKQLVYTKQYKHGYSPTAFTELASPLFGVAPLHLEDLDMIVWLFPNDPALPHLFEAVDWTLVKKHLPLLFQNADDVRVKVEIVNYRPEIRCTAWYEVRDKSLEKPFNLFGKTYADDRYKDIYHRLMWMWNYTRGANAFLMPPLAGYSNEIKTFWQYELEGRPLLGVINPSNYQTLLEQIAQRLDFLNRCEVPCPVRETNAEQLKEVTKKIKKLKLVFPHLQARLEILQCSLEKTLSSLEPAPQWVVHGDFHLRQMLLHQDQIVLFDFDECSLGDPVEDVAHFIADLYIYSFDKPFIETMSQVFLEAYAKYSNWSVPLKRLAWHLQIQFINRAYRSYLQQKPDLTTLVESYILLAEMKGNVFLPVTTRYQTLVG